MARTRPKPVEPTERVVATDAEARALASSLRLRILRVCLEPHTNRELADIVGLNPATTLHHVRRLVDTGFLVAQPVRRGARGSREIPYLSTRKSWQLNTPAQGTVLIEAFLEEIAEVSISEVEASRLGLRVAPDRLVELRDRLHALLDEFASEADDPSAPAWSLFVALHPDPNRP
jgi:predicted ArsR family transcriptional regulator